MVVFSKAWAYTIANKNAYVDWKYSFSPKYLYTETNPQPYKDVEGTEQSYCSLKDGSTAMLQFEDHKNSQTGAI